MGVFKPPQQIILNKNIKSIFLAGTIDMGNSYNWQEEVTKYFSIAYDIYNPRRNDWDFSWKQTIEDAQFYQQVNWELDALNKADIIIMNFLPNSQSPITLLELGLYASSGKLIVCCPDEFWRSGNVQIICNNYNIPLFKNIKELINFIQKL